MYLLASVDETSLYAILLDPFDFILIIRWLILIPFERGYQIKAGHRRLCSLGKH